MLTKKDIKVTFIKSPSALRNPPRCRKPPLFFSHLSLLMAILLFSTGCDKVEEAFDIVLDMVGKTKTQLEKKRIRVGTIDKKKATTDSATTGAGDQGDAIPDEKKKVEFYYNPVGKRDPFRSFIAIMQETHTPKNKRQRQLEDTETYELNQYQLTALISGTSNPLAMVEDPTGEGHVLRVGSRIGKNGGRVTRITSTAVVVIEEFRAPTGERVRVPITVKLPEAGQTDSKLTSSVK